MWQLIFFVLDDPARIDDLLAAWAQCGVRGASVTDSMGMARRMGYVDESQPIEASVGFISQDETHHYTLFALIDESIDPQTVLAETERVVGDLDKPYTGVFAVLPVAMVKGLRSTGN